ncbi:MAG TPA: hypothetical protein GXZ47_00385 [Treponema sp.]|nr:hypothetical protein [Treponema sp.]
MNTTDTYVDTLETVLNQQIELLSNLYACQKRMYESVLVRDWVLLQKELALSSEYAESFKKLDDNRIAVLCKIGPHLDAANGFYRITALLPESDKMLINNRYREMKRLLLLSKTENDIFTTYITNAKSLVSGMLDTVVSGKKSKIYTRNGALASTNVASVVLNRSF